MEKHEAINPTKQEQWQQEKAIVDNITDRLGMKIDEGIKDTVIALRLLGLNTTQSHEGKLDRYPIPYIDIVSPEAIVLSRKRNKKIEELKSDELEKFKTPQSEEITALGEKMILENAIEQQRIEGLLQSFYENRTVSEEVKLTLEISALGSMRLQSFGAEAQEEETDDTKIAERLTEFQAEMYAFTEFLKAQFFK
jgi:hypothetical protein